MPILDQIPWLSILVFWPLVGMIIILFMRNESAIKSFAVWWSVVPCIITTYLWFAYVAGGGSGFQFVERAPWIPQLGITYNLGVDGISLPLLWMSTIMTTVALAYSRNVINTRVKEYFALFLLLEMGMLGVFVSLDMFLFYVFWEIGLVPMYFLIGVWGGARREYAAIKFFLYTLAGSVFMLLAIIAVYFRTGTFNILDAAALAPFAGEPVLQILVFLGFFLAFAIKVPMFPFHTWLPDAHVEAPTAGSVVLAAVLLKLGTYGFVRISLPMFPEAFNLLAIPIALLALIGIIYGALVAMAQWDFKKLIAYSSVNHMGYVMLGLAASAYLLPYIGEGGLGGENRAAYANTAAAGVNGAVYEMLAHGFITGALFLMVGLLYDQRTHTRDLKRYGGLFGLVPKYAGFLILFAMASLGLPGLMGFVAEFLIFRGAFPAGSWITVFALLGVLGIIFTAALFLWKVIQLILLGPPAPEWAEGEHKLLDLTRREVWILAPMMLATVIFGIFPGLLLNLINPSTLDILASASNVAVALAPFLR
ncbi:MAG: NADH-quinone oxidoreductase subunit M [Anaerolineae bacterium]|nr:NADH-quinone oxidoreductase subunit M [Anaerolineae bacterium]